MFICVISSYILRIVNICACYLSFFKDFSAVFNWNKSRLPGPLDIMNIVIKHVVLT